MNPKVATARNCCCWRLSPVSSLLVWRSWSCPQLCPISLPSSPLTDPHTLQDFLEFREFYYHRTCILGYFSMTIIGDKNTVTQRSWLYDHSCMWAVVVKMTYWEEFLWWLETFLWWLEYFLHNSAQPQKTDLIAIVKGWKFLGGFNT